MPGPYNYYADNYSDAVPEIANALVPVVRPFVLNLANLVAAMTVNSETKIGAADKIYLAPIPGVQGIYLLDWDIIVPEMDTGSQFSFELGDSTAVARFLTTNTAGQTAGGHVYAAASGVLGALPCRYKPDGTATKLGDDAFIMTVVATPSTGTTTGIIKGWVKYCLYGTGPLTFGNEPA